MVNSFILNLGTFNLSYLVFIKVVLVAFLVLFTIFELIVVKQTYTLENALKTEVSPLLFYASLVIFIFSAVLLVMAIGL